MRSGVCLRPFSYSKEEVIRSLSTFRRYWRLLARYLRTLRLHMALLAIILAGAIAVQAGAPLAASRFLDRAASGGALEELLLLAVLTIALSLAGQALAIAETYVAEHVSWEATNALRADLLAHILRLDTAFHTTHTPGELIERADGDVTILARFFSQFTISILGNGALIAGVLALLAAIDWRISLALGLFVALALTAMLRIRAAATPDWAAERQANADFYSFVGEYLGGLEDVRSSGAGAFVMRRCAEIMRAWLAATRRAQLWGYALVATGHGLFALGMVVAFGLSALLYAEGTLTIGAVYLIFRYAEMLRQPTEQIRNEVQDLQQADASIGRIEALLATPPRHADHAGAALPPGRLTIELERVTFGYAADAPILRDVSFSVAPGRVLGIVGRTGSGKTTLTRLLGRFYDPQAGSVRLGGVDLQHAPAAAARARIGLVTQDVQLFNASLRDNLTLFDDRVPEERIRAALATLGLADWLTELPHGLDTMLGAGGFGLSAGQEQVLACARVLLRDPDVVILDEASSRLDTATERLVHMALGRLLEGRTGIIVAHRLSTIAYADDILVLADGQVREYGSRSALAADPQSRFAELLRSATQEVIP
jgi:ABC-type multidrug transport system fused ATPase/permease subunit